jgi:hypothetical protein
VAGAVGPEEASGVVVLPQAPSVKATPAANPAIAILLFLAGGLTWPPFVALALCLPQAEGVPMKRTPVNPGSLLRPVPKAPPEPCDAPLPKQW